MKSSFKSFFRSLHHRFLPTKLWSRSLLIMLTPVILIQTVGGIYFYDNHWQSVGRRLALGIASEIKSAIALYEAFPEGPDRDLVLRTLQHNLRLNISFSAPVEDAKSRKIKSFIRTAELIPALEGIGFPFEIRPTEKNEETKGLYVTFYTPKTTAEVYLPYKFFFSSTTYVFALWVSVLSLLLFGIAAVFMRNQIRPVLHLAEAAENFGLGRDVDKFKPEGAAEVRKAALSFMKMRDRIRRHIEERTRMLAGVSHDLRTPLTRMRLQLSMMGETPEAAELLNDVIEMEHMVNGYLDFIRGNDRKPAEQTNIPRLIADAIEPLRKEGVSLNFTATEPLIMNVRANDLKRCVWNLVSNAQRYASIVNVALNVGKDRAEIVVEDNGPGIPADKREDVFKAFYRLDESRNSETGGTGLGLTITRDIVMAHGGKITLEDSELGGLKAVLSFPK